MNIGHYFDVVDIDRYNAILGTVFCRQFGVCLDFDLLATAWRIHREAPDPRAVVIAYLLLLSIEPDTLADEVIAARTPYVERHFKSDDQYSLVDLTGPFPQWMLSIVLQT